MVLLPRKAVRDEWLADGKAPQTTHENLLQEPRQSRRTTGWFHGSTHGLSRAFTFVDMWMKPQVSVTLCFDHRAFFIQELRTFRSFNKSLDFM